MKFSYLLLCTVASLGSLRATDISGTINSGIADQIYTDAVNLTGAFASPTLLTAGGQIDFDSTVNGPLFLILSTVATSITGTTFSGTTITGTTTSVTAIGNTVLGVVGDTTELQGLWINRGLAPGTSLYPTYPSGTSDFGGTTPGPFTGTIAPGGTTTLNGNITTTSYQVSGALDSSAEQIYGNAVVLGNDIELDSRISPEGQGGNITFNSTLDGAHSLTVSTTGTMTLGPVGQTTVLTSLTTESGKEADGSVETGVGTTLLNGNVTTTGAQTYLNRIILGNDVTLLSTSGSAAILGSVSGSHALTVVSGSMVTFSNAVGTGFSVSVSANSLDLGTSTVNLTGPTTFTIASPFTLHTVNGGSLSALTVSNAVTLDNNVTTGETQTWNGPVTLGNDITMSVTNPDTATPLGGNFTLSSVSGGGHALTISIPGFGRTFLGDVSGVSTLTDTSGAITLTGSNISVGTLNTGTTGVTLASAVTITTTSPLTLPGVIGSGNALTLVTGTATLGTTASLASLTDLDGAMTFTGIAYNITNLNLTGTLTLGNNMTVTGSSATLGGLIGGAHNLTLFTSGSSSLGTVSGVGTLTDNTGTLTLTTGTLSATTLALGASVTLQNDTLLTGATTLGTTIGGGHALKIIGAATLNTISGVSTLTDTNGLVTLNSGNISADTINFGGQAITLQGATTLTAPSGITLTGGVTGNANALTLVGPATVGSMAGLGASGVTLFTDTAGPVTLSGNNYQVSLGVNLSGTVSLGSVSTTTINDNGSSIRLGTVLGQSHSLTLSGGGIATLGSVSGVANFTMTNALTLNGNVGTSGFQTYNNGVTLGADATLASSGGGPVNFVSTVDGAHALTVTTGGAVTLGAVGDTTPLASLSVSAASLTIAHDVKVSGALSLTTAGSAITQSGGIFTIGDTSSFNAGTGNITLTSAGNIFTGAVSLTGSDASLTSAHALTLGNATLSTLVISATAGTTVLGNVSAASVTVSAGSLQLGNGGTTGAVSGNVSLTGGGTLAFDRDDVVNYAGTISGNGALTQLGGGQLTLTGTSSYSGATTVAAGSLQLGNGGTTGMISGNVSLAGGGTLAFNRSDSVLFTGAISGNGGVTQLGSGTLTLTADSSYTGTTTISGGKLVLGGNSASSSFAIAAGAALELNVVSADRDFAATTFSGSGTLVKSGTSAAYWGAASATFQMAAGSLIDVQGGSLFGGSNGNEIWTNNQSGLNVASGAAFYGVEANVRVDALTGAGLITSGYSGGSYQGFTFGVANGSGTFSGVLADHPGFTGNFTKAGTGTQILTGANTYTGTTTISGGVLQLGNGGTTGTLTSSRIVDNGTLAFDRSDALSYGGTISGTGGVAKLANGMLALTGSSSYTGPTTIVAGSLLVDGNLSGSGLISVTGGAIGGNGSVGGSIHFGLGAGIVFDPSSTLAINGATVTFDGFSMANVIGLDSTTADGTYALLDGSAAFDFTNVANFGAANAYSLGNGKSAYFQAGSLDVVVVPEPGTMALLLMGSAGLWAWRRRSSVSRLEYRESL